MDERLKILQIAVELFGLSSENRARFFAHIGIEATSSEVEQWSAALMGAFEKPNFSESCRGIRNIDHLSSLVAAAQDEKERVKLALYHLDAIDREAAVPGRAINKVLPEKFVSKNIRTPLGRLIQDNEVVEIPSQKDGGHPSYFLNSKGCKNASQLVDDYTTGTSWARSET